MIDAFSSCCGAVLYCSVLLFFPMFFFIAALQQYILNAIHTIHVKHLTISSSVDPSITVIVPQQCHDEAYMLPIERINTVPVLKKTRIVGFGDYPV